MIRLFVAAFLLAVGAADKKLEAEPAGAVVQVYKLEQVHRDIQNEHLPHYDHYQKEKYLEHRPHHTHHGGHHFDKKPINVHLDTIDKHGHHGHGMSNIERIVSEVHNPDYLEPIRLLDYRYLKSGGRDYTRGDGGQILILPKNVRVNEKKEFSNYDELLEFLRLKQIAELEASRMKLSKLGYEQRHNDHYQHRIEIGSHGNHNPHGYEAYGYAGNQRPQLVHGHHTELHKRGVEPVPQNDEKPAEKSV